MPRRDISVFRHENMNEIEKGVLSKPPVAAPPPEVTPPMAPRAVFKRVCGQRCGFTPVTAVTPTIIVVNVFTITDGSSAAWQRDKRCRGGEKSFFGQHFCSFACTRCTNN